ncbi:DUF3656 domain-containing U32 family peptidase [Methanosarcina sp. Mfa9]|uniref:DUF3656 domain-containing U32 family peptidase n=1 Tax=Methanosarcina sp. Mfa9 TaxID=3439063 RepID=UPI003F86B4AA
MSEKTSANHCPPEILAPAGDYDAFLSAIKGGADAVYLGTGEFNARRGAKNLSSRELEKAIDKAHSHGVKVYLAFNIPIKEHELQPALDLIDQAYAASVDAIILRDPGLFRLLKATFPDLPLHASTQMTIHNKAGVRFVEELGASRVIVSRELSTAEVRDIVDSSKIGVEVFVHGALCYSYSGRCLFSSFVSDRSGNLGACAQPCRWKYDTLVDGKPQTEIMGGEYPLSCAELCTLPGLDKIVASGVESLKIEGRMKKPEYVTGSSKIYKEAVERICKSGKYLSPEELAQKEKELAKLFSRGFTKGFILGDRAVAHLEYGSDYGVYLGKVEKVVRSKPYGRITLTLHEEIEVNDGIGIHTRVNTKTGMLGSLVNGIISKNGKHVERAKKGEKVTLEISFKTGEVVNPQDEVFLSTDRSFLEGLQEMKVKPLPVNIRVTARKGERLKVTVESPGEIPGKSSGESPVDYVDSVDFVEFEDEYVVQPAQKSPTIEEAIRKAMEQLGETPYDVGTIKIEADEEIFIPVGALKSARRQALELLLEKSTGIRKKELKHPQLSDLAHLYKNEAEVSGAEDTQAEVSGTASAKPTESESSTSAKNPQSLRLSVEVNSPEGLFQAVEGKADIVYIPIESFHELRSPEYRKRLKFLLKKGLEIVFTLPLIAHDREMEALTPLLRAVKEAGFTVACSDFGTIQLAKELGIPFVARKDLTPFNSFTVDTLKKAGAYRVGLSSELNMKEIRAVCEALEACGKTEEIELTVHGRELLLITENDLLKPLIDRNVLKPGSEVQLLDRQDRSFPVKRWGTRTLIYNSEVLSMLKYIKGLKGSGADVLRLDLTLNGEKEIKDIVRAYSLALEGKKGKLKYADVEYSTGHYFHGI